MAEALGRLARPLDDLEALLHEAGAAQLVCIGEASHGTHEFYQLRADLTRRLIADFGFSGVAVEADWPDADRVNRYVRHRGDDRNADASLSGFRRFPQWMWRNHVVLDFVEWLREHNGSRPSRAQAGFHGIDLYSLFTSIERVLTHLDEVDPEAAARARYRYSCFEHYGEDPQQYGQATAFDLSPLCEEEVVRQLRDLHELAAHRAPRDDDDEDARFSAEQNARVVIGAEHYYRTMFRDRVASWNLRDSHMAETVEELLRHHGRHGEPARLVLWAHNSHLGDARATRMGWEGEHNVGQLLRERHGPRACYLVGFTTDHGTVTAARDWELPAEAKEVRPGLPGSWERLFHEAGPERFWLPMHDDRVAAALGEPRIERAIGVIYRPETERLSHYFEADLVAQFDAVIHIDETHALEPLERTPGWREDEPAETYPWGI